jgi:hypothetical protein
VLENLRLLDFFLIFPSQPPKLLGKGKGDEVVLGGKKLVQLIINPFMAFMVLAMRAIPVAAGMWDICLASTLRIGASGQHVRAMLLPALPHSL